MENLKNSSNMSRQIELDFKKAQMEIKQLKRENQQFAQNCSQLQEKLNYALKSSSKTIEKEQEYQRLVEENKLLHSQLSQYQGGQLNDHILSGKPTYQQIEGELQDLQKMFKRFYELQEKQIKKLLINLLDQLINCQYNCLKNVGWLFYKHLSPLSIHFRIFRAIKMNQLRWNNFINNQFTQNIVIQLIYKRLQNSIYDMRLEIERVRKETQMKQGELKKLDGELAELETEFQYICRIESRRFTQQIEQEKQLISLKQKTQGNQESRLRQQSDFFHNPTMKMESQSQQSIKKPMFRVTRQNDDMIRAQSDADQSMIEKTIEQTRKKLSRQLSLASNLSRR